MNKDDGLDIPQNTENSFSMRIRENFSMDEIQKMLADIGAAVSSYKAEQQGIDPEKMVKTIRGGRIVWITIEEMNAVLAKQKRITSSKKTQRAVRGEDSISNEITRRIEVCRSIINTVRRISPEDTQEFTRSLRNLESLQNLSITNAREVRILEAAIRRKKQEDPLLREMDMATEEMMAALQQNELAEVDVCQSFCDRHMDEYLARQKRIEPYIKKAKEYRLAFLLSKQQLYQSQFELIEKGELALSKHIEEVMYYDREAKYAESLVQYSNEIRSNVSNSRQFIDRLTALLPEELEDQKDFFIETDKNHLTPLFDMMVCFVEAIYAAWKEIAALKKTNAAHESSSEIKAIRKQ